jgi:hypothetical protein
MKSELSKPMVAYLKAAPKHGYRNHFELRGHGNRRDGDLGWWRVYDHDKPNEFIGTEDNLPLPARRELAALRAEPLIGSIRQARHINASLLLFPNDPHNGIPHIQSVNWLKQYPYALTKTTEHLYYTTTRGYMVVAAVPGDETCPTEIWESVYLAEGKRKIDELDSSYRLVWKRPLEED